MAKGNSSQDAPRTNRLTLSMANCFGFVPSYLRGLEPARTPTAGGGEAAELEAPGGPAWEDPTFVASLREQHERLGASERSLASLEELANGAACVITGQQPALGGGPLYTWWKIAATVVVARRLSARGPRKVVPVFWLGADDSDFDEARRAHHAVLGRPPHRLQLPGDVWAKGERIGDLDAERVLAFEQDCGIRSSRPRGHFEDWGELAMADLLADFSASGLVIVDARNPALLERGRDLFTRGFEERQELAALLRRRASELFDLGWPVSLEERAFESPVFALRSGRRVRVMTSAELEGQTLSPTVLLRPLWQDRELGPLVTILGPSELAYQAQLTPLYRHFGVRGPRTLPRPHLLLSPVGPQDRFSDTDLDALATSAEDARHLLDERGLSDASRQRLETLERALEEATLALPESRPWRRFLARQRRELGRLRRALARDATGPFPGVLPWLWPGGAVQERVLSVSALRAAGIDGDQVVDRLDAVYPGQIQVQPPWCGWLSVLDSPVRALAQDRGEDS